MEGVPRILPFLLIILFVLYALYGGLATPSEIAAVVAASSFLLVLFIYGRTSPRAWLGTLKETVRESTMILFIIAAAGLFSYMMSMLYVTQSVAEWIIATDMNRWVLFGFLNVLMLIAGCFLPPVAIILMVMPIIQPILMLNDFDMIWFGIVMTINLEIALITPPVGLNLYVLRGVSPDIPLKTILAGSVPFVLLMLLSIVILCFLPGIALWLPNALM
jgi:tripartite ATP-independent transporter DctM subunit